MSFLSVFSPIYNMSSTVWTLIKCFYFEVLVLYFIRFTIEHECDLVLKYDSWILQQHYFKCDV